MINPFGMNQYQNFWTNGLINSPAPIGYGVTHMPLHLPTFWSLGDRYWTSNFGMETQHNIYEGGYNPLVYKLAQNPQLMYTNPMLLGLTDGMGASPMMPGLSPMTPGVAQPGVDLARQAGENAYNTARLQSVATKALLPMEASLTNLLKSDKLTNAQKATIQGLLEEINTLKKKIEDKLKANNTTTDDVNTIQKETLDLQKKVEEASKSIYEEISKAQDSSATGDTSSSTGAAASSSTDLTGTEYENIDPETGRPTKIGEAPSKSECRQFCATIFDAIDGIGTKNEVIEQTIPALTESNIVEVISYWDKNYGSGDQGMIRRLLDDLGHYEKKKYVPMLLNALQTRAEALGIDDEIDQYVTNITKELGDCNISDGICSRNLMAIYDKIVEKETANKTGAKEALDNKKAENNKKVEGRKQEVETEKRNEFAKKMKEQLKLNEVPQLAAGLKVETDENGEFTGYSIELNTPNGKITVKGATYHQLVLEIEKNNLKAEDVLIRNTNA